MILVFLQSPYREDGPAAQFVGHFGQITDASVVPALRAFLLEASPVYNYAWMEVFSTVTKRWYHATLDYEQPYDEAHDKHDIVFTELKPRASCVESVVFFRNFTLQQGNNKMVTGNAQDVMNDALRRMENLSAALTTAQQAQILAQKAAQEATKAIDAVMKVQGDVVFLHNLMQQFAGMFGTMDAAQSGPTEDAPAQFGLPPVNREPDPMVPVQRRGPVSLVGTAGALLGQEPAAPTEFAPAASARPGRLPASPALGSLGGNTRPALEALGVAAERMVGELGRHRAAVQAETGGAPARRSGPQEEVEPPQGRQHPGATEDNSQYIGHFVGAHSLFVRFLHPEVTTGGRGFVKPGYAGLKQYKQDVSQISADVLNAENDWTTGFYRNGTTGTRQFFVKLDSAMVLVDNPMMPNNFPLIAFRTTGPVVWRQLRTLTVEELRLVHDQLRALFQEMEEIDRNTPQARA
jgi:hypothetical protein